MPQCIVLLGREHSMTCKMYAYASWAWPDCIYPVPRHFTLITHATIVSRAPHLGHFTAVLLDIEGESST